MHRQTSREWQPSIPNPLLDFLFVVEDEEDFRRHLVLADSAAAVGGCHGPIGWWVGSFVVCFLVVEGCSSY